MASSLKAALKHKDRPMCIKFKSDSVGSTGSMFANFESERVSASQQSHSHSRTAPHFAFDGIKCCRAVECRTVDFTRIVLSVQK